VPGESRLALRSALLGRGYQYLEGDQPKANRFINDGVQLICGKELWPFLLTSVVVNDGQPLPDRRGIAIVRDSAGEKLNRLDFAMTAQRASSAGYGYFVSGGAIHTLPTSLSGMTVHYYAEGAVMDDDADLCVIPRSFSDVVLDAAAIGAAKDAREWGEVATLRSELDVGVERMREQLIDEDYSAPTFLPIPED
jgi:hypothetical protein